MYNGFIIRKPLSHSKPTEMPPPQFIEGYKWTHNKPKTGNWDILNSRTCLYNIRIFF